MILNWSMDGKAFSVFVEHFLVPNLWKGAVVVMDNLPAHSSGGDWTLDSIGWLSVSSIYYPILRTLIR